MISAKELQMLSSKAFYAGRDASKTYSGSDSVAEFEAYRQELEAEAAGRYLESLGFARYGPDDDDTDEIRMIRAASQLSGIVHRTRDSALSAKLTVIREYLRRNPKFPWPFPMDDSPEPDRARVVCLCGSTRFWDQYQLANYRETMAGKIVLTVGHYPHSPGQAHGETVGCTPSQKAELDKLHCRKIDMADEVFVIDVNGYAGESTRREIAYAKATGKQVRYISEEWPKSEWWTMDDPPSPMSP